MEEAASQTELSARSSWPIAFAKLRINPASRIPIYEQICQALRTVIEAGDLPPCTLLPTSREAAKVLGIGRNTVVEAYSRLVAEGYLTSNTRRGTRVAQSTKARGTLDAAPLEPMRLPAGIVPDIAYQARKALEFSLASNPEGRPFALHAPDPALYPRYHLGRTIAKEFRCVLAGDTQRKVGFGSQHFRTVIANYLRRSAGISCHPEQVIPTTGLRNALDITIRTLIDPGHNVYVEDPCMDVVRAAFGAAGAHLHYAPCDLGGADVSSVSGPPPRMIFVSPSANFPFGRQMSELRRMAAVDLARRSGAVIFECDTHRAFSYTAQRLQAIYGLDRSGHVLYFGRLTEVLGSHIRLGYLIAPPTLMDAFGEMAKRLANGPDSFILGAVAKFMDENHYASHLRTIHAVYLERLRRTVDALRTHLPNAAVTEPAGGFHVVITFRERLDEYAVQNEAAAQGLAVTPLSRFFQMPPMESGLVLGFAAVPERTITSAIGRLADIVRRAQEKPLRPAAHLTSA